jgi:probable F420-dependent oxidoreductase
MRVGVDIPYFAAAADVREYVQGVEALGFDHVGFSEHVCSTLDTEFPAPMFTFDEPWRESFTLASFVAALTSRIEINPAMTLLPLYHPVLAAKLAAEVANLSDGRLRIAASIGWNARECESLGVDPATRGARFEEQVGLVRRLLSERAVDHHGRFFVLREAGISARPAAPVPLWMGAGKMNEGGFPSERALDRAARVADGFKFAAPTFADLDRVAAAIDRLLTVLAVNGRDAAPFGIEVRMAVQMTTPDKWVSVIERARAMGATHLGVANRIAGGTVGDQLEWCRRFVDATRGAWA